MSAQPRENRKNVQVKFRLTKTTKAQLDAIAQHRGTSLTAEIVRALTAYVEVAKPEAR